MSNTCNFKTSEASTKAWFRTNGLIDKYLNIPSNALVDFRKQNQRWSEYATEQYGVSGILFSESMNGAKAVPNTEMFYKIDAAKGVFYSANEYLKASQLSPLANESTENLDILTESNTLEDDELKTDVSAISESMQVYDSIVKMNNGRKPIQFMAGDLKWQLNNKGLYNLIDKFTNDVYLRNVNLETGEVVPDVDPGTPASEAKRDRIFRSIMQMIKEQKLDEYLAVKGIDTVDIYEDLRDAKTDRDLNKVLETILKAIC
jgi:hypothetical protein